MTIQDLYNWAKQNNKLDWAICFKDAYQLPIPITVSDEGFDYVAVEEKKTIIFK